MQTEFRGDTALAFNRTYTYPCGCGRPLDRWPKPLLSTWYRIANPVTPGEADGYQPPEVDETETRRNYLPGS